MRGLYGRLYVVDNHKVLMAYWCMALALSAGSERRLALNARLTVGCVMALASFWKWVSKDFVDGSFMHFSLLADSRFEAFAKIAAGVSDETVQNNTELIGLVISGRLANAQLLDSGSSVILAHAVTYWTLFSESVIAILFLVPLKWKWLHSMRNVALLHFVILTYPIATVIGFGWILTIMGYSQCSMKEQVSALVYLTVFAILQLYLIPFSSVLDL